MAAPDTRKRRAASRAPATNDRARANGDTVELSKQDVQQLLDALRAARDGEVGVRLAVPKSGVMGDVARAFNGLAQKREGLTDELNRVSKVIGREGRMTERAKLKNAKGSWAESVASVNPLASRDQQLANIRQIYPPEREALGVVAIGIELVDPPRTP